MPKTTPKQRLTLKAISIHLSSLISREFIPRIIDELEEAELRAAQWGAMVRRGWSIRRYDSTYYIGPHMCSGAAIIGSGPTEQAAIDAAFERYPLVKP